MQKLLFHPLTVGLITLGAVIFWFSLHKTSSDILSSTQNTQLIQNDIDLLTNQIADLEYQLDEAQKPITKERIARDELLLQLPEEKIVKLPDLPPTDQAPPPPAEKSPWQEWQELLF